MERRFFVRVRVEVPVRYKLIQPSGEKISDELFEGTTSDIASGGMLLVGRLPDPAFVIELLAQRVRLSLNMVIPGDPQPLKAVARTAWIERFEEGTGIFPMGLSFENIDDADRTRIQRYVIRAQIG